MFILDKVKIAQILQDEFAYSPEESLKFIDTLQPIQDELKPIVTSWLENRNFNDIKIFNLSIKDLMRIHGMNFLEAIRDINRLFDPNLDISQRKRLASVLSKPFKKI